MSKEVDVSIDLFGSKPTKELALALLSQRPGFGFCSRLAVRDSRKVSDLWPLAYRAGSWKPPCAAPLERIGDRCPRCQPKSKQRAAHLRIGCDQAAGVRPMAERGGLLAAPGGTKKPAAARAAA